MLENILKLSRLLHQKKPLVLNITNEVTLDFVANGLLSVGASPIMSKARQEMEDLMQYANAIVINLGTLNDEFISLCQFVCQVANQWEKPIILDPVGAGASRYRTESCMALLNEYRISIVRGNASEIMALSGSTQKTKGVDSIAECEQAIEHAKKVSKRFDAAVVMSGKIDIVVDQELLEQCAHGSFLMPMVTGTGCLLSAVVAAFHSIETNRFKAAHIATLFYAMCGEQAEKAAKGPGSFRVQFLDALHSFSN